MPPFLTHAAPHQAVKEKIGNDKKKELKQVVKPKKEKVEKKNEKSLCLRKGKAVKKV
jgi:hypothetical protein